MPAEKKEVLNLMYLFNEGDLYAVEEKDPLPPDLWLFEAEPTTPEAMAEIPIVIPPESTPEPTPAFPDEPTEEPASFFVDELLPPVDEATLLLAEPILLPAETQPPAAEWVPEEWIAPLAVAQPTEPTEETKPTQTTPTATPPPAATKSTHSIMLIVDEARAELLNPYDTEFLAKVLQAVGLDPDGVSLVNVSAVEDPDYYYVFKEKKVRQFVSFGVAMDALNLYLPLLPYEPKLIYGIQFLYVDSLEGIRTDVERKKWLWTALKQMFGA